MGTTPRGIAYPDDSSPIENLRAYLQQIAETADAAIAAMFDGDWQPLTLLNGWVAYPSPPIQAPRVLKASGFTVIEGTVTGTTAASTDILDLPPGLQPTGGEIRFAPDVVGTGTTDPVGIAIDSAGLLRYNGPLPVTLLSISCTFWSGL